MMNDSGNRDWIRRRIELEDADAQRVPPEFSGIVYGFERHRGGVEYSLLTFATLSFAAASLIPFFSHPFVQRDFALRANSLEPGEGLGFVTFMDTFEDTSGLQMKDMFGWGALDLVSRASQALAPHLQACRAQLQGSASGLVFRFDVKVDVNKPGFSVNGLLEGAEREPAMAGCLRDKINTLAISDFSNLRAASPKSYKLRLGVQMAHGSDGGAP